MDLPELLLEVAERELRSVGVPLVGFAIVGTGLEVDLRPRAGNICVIDRRGDADRPRCPTEIMRKGKREFLELVLSHAVLVYEYRGMHGSRRAEQTSVRL